MNRFWIYAVLFMAVLSYFLYQNGVISSQQADFNLLNGKYDRLVIEKDGLAASLAESEESKKKLMADAHRLDGLIAAREAELLSSKKRLVELSGQLKELRKTNEEYKTWSDAHVPDAVIRLLHNTRDAGDSKN